MRLYAGGSPLDNDALPLSTLETDAIDVNVALKGGELLKYDLYFSHYAFTIDHNASLYIIFLGILVKLRELWLDIKAIVDVHIQNL